LTPIQLPSDGPLFSLMYCVTSLLMIRVILLIVGCRHSKEACPDDWHFCGSPPQEQIPRGTAG
jgi:hypothetical protein